MEGPYIHTCVLIVLEHHRSWDACSWVAVRSHSSVVREPVAKAENPGFDFLVAVLFFFSLPAELLME